jgi:hypothetical protein
MLLAMHSQSRGALLLTQEHNQVHARIELSVLDVPELCGSGVVWRGDASEVESCVRGRPLATLRMVQRGACALDSWRAIAAPPADVHLLGTWTCPHDEGEVQLDWGPFAGTELQHIAMASFAGADGRTDKTLLSRQATRWQFALSAPANVMGWWWTAAAIAAGAALLAGVWMRTRRAR